MMHLVLPLRGIAAGLIIAAPVGPVNVICIQRTLEKSWRSGILSAFGAALADTVYGAIAAFGISLVISFLVREEFWFRLIGGILLMAIGFVYYFKEPASLERNKQHSSPGSDLASTFFLTATNPTTILSYLVVLAALGLGQQRPLWETTVLVGGIFSGSMLWWIVLTTGANMLRSKVTDKTMGVMNHVAGVAIGAFGLLNVILSRGHRH